uniref:Pre-mRNA-splicing factor CWC21 n=1 Tax=Blastobotrys adeninivorans TaxID=409370 RepID=A0A060TAA7_BLAAD
MRRIGIFDLNQNCCSLSTTAMSYNGIGLQTARGSGTSGYIQSNRGSRAQFNPGFYEQRKANERLYERGKEKTSLTNLSDRKVDEGIIEHEKKRAVEAKCFELQDELEEKGVDEAEIEQRVSELRQKLLKEQQDDSKNAPGPSRKAFQAHQVHEMAEARKQENDRMQRAFEDGKRNQKDFKGRSGRRYEADGLQGDGSIPTDGIEITRKGDYYRPRRSKSRSRSRSRHGRDRRERRRHRDDRDDRDDRGEKDEKQAREYRRERSSTKPSKSQSPSRKRSISSASPERGREVKPY